MKIAAWVWQLQNDYPGANADDSKLPIDEMWVKAADGMWPQGQFDNHPAEISGLPAAIALRNIYEQQGVNLIPWVVPHGKWPGSGPGPRDDTYAFAEGKMHGQYAAAAKSTTGNDRAVLIIDLEPSYYGGAIKQFWRDDLGAGPSDVDQYLAGALAGGASEVWLSSVWRNDPQALVDCSIGAWLANPIVTEVHPQVYWTDFGKPWGDALAEFARAYQVLGGRGIIPAAFRQRIRPTMPGPARPADIAAFISACAQRGYLRPSIFRRGNTSADVWTTIAGLASYAAPTPPTPPPESGPSAADLAMARGALTDAQNAIAKAQRALGG